MHYRNEMAKVACDPWDGTGLVSVSWYILLARNKGAEMAGDPFPRYKLKPSK